MAKMNKMLVEIGKLQDFSNNNPVDLEIENIPLTVVKINSEVNAFIRVCSHEDKIITKTKLKNGCLFCPFHGGKVSFDACSGNVVTRDGKHVPQGLRKLVTENVDGKIFVRLVEDDFGFIAKSVNRRTEHEKLKKKKRQNSGKKGFFEKLAQFLGGER